MEGRQNVVQSEWRRCYYGNKQPMLRLQSSPFLFVEQLLQDLLQVLTAALIPEVTPFP